MRALPLVLSLVLALAGCSAGEIRVVNFTTRTQRVSGSVECGEADESDYKIYRVAPIAIAAQGGITLAEPLPGDKIFCAAEMIPEQEESTPLTRMCMAWLDGDEQNLRIELTLDRDEYSVKCKSVRR